MREDEVQIIKGGWRNVPENLKCKSDLKRIGLVPKKSNKPSALVWNCYNWIQLYNLADCRPKRKPTEKQLEALKKGQAKLRELLTCSQCGAYVYFHQNLAGDGDICRNCHEQNEWKAKNEMLRKEYKNMKKEGEDFFRRWFYEDFVILDTETTGLNDAEIVELSIIDKKGNVLFDSLFKPKYPIPEEVIKIHGITNEMVASAPTWENKQNEIRNILEDKNVVIYNAEFDCKMFRSTNQIWTIGDHIPFTAGCSMEAYRKYVGYERWVKLSEASGIWTAHRALNDCFSVLTLLDNVWAEIGLIESRIEK